MSLDARPARVTSADLAELLPLVRAYCDFYEVAPSDEALLAVSVALVADPGLEGVQLIARGGEGTAVGFATVYWSWDTLIAARIGIMHDLYVVPEARGRGSPTRSSAPASRNAGSTARPGSAGRPRVTTNRHGASTSARARRARTGSTTGSVCPHDPWRYPHSSCFAKRLPLSSRPTRR